MIMNDKEKFFAWVSRMRYKPGSFVCSTCRFSECRLNPNVSGLPHIYVCVYGEEHMVDDNGSCDKWRKK